VIYYYICDNCGSIADITETKHPDDGPQWACADCDSTALWEFTDKDKAVLHGKRIRDARFAAKMAGLDQARAALDS
jgi:predicted nucleic acid-binding Zn ribbon protein